MKKLWSLLSILFFATAVFGAAVPTTGLVTTSNCSTIPNPVKFQTWCGLTTDGQIYVYNGAGYTAITGGAGTVTSVGAVGTANQITVTGASPITGSGSWTFSIPTNPTLPGNTTGTFIGNLTGDVTGTASGNTTNASALTANLPVIGAGLNAIAVGTRTGNTTQFATSTGTQTSGRCVEIDANGNHVAASGACGIAGSGYGTIQEEGSNLTARTTMNFVGAGVTAADDAGNSRTNITIPGGATLAQGTLAGRGGASGSGLAEEITLGTNLSFSGTTLNAAGGTSGLTKIECKTITSNTTTSTFSSLDGNTDGAWLLQGKIVNNSGGSLNYYLRPNGATTNLSSAQGFAGSSTGGTTDGSNAVFGFATASANGMSFSIRIYPKKNPNSIATPLTYEGTGQTQGSSLFTFSHGGVWNETSTNVTSLDLVAQNANGIGNGSEYCLYKYAQ